MRRIIMVIIFAGVFMFFTAKITSAVLLPFGGKVVTPFLPGVVCPGWGPVMIVPAGIGLPGPFYLPFTKLSVPKPGSQIMGKFIEVPVPLCPTAALGVPMPVFVAPVWMAS